MSKNIQFKKAHLTLVDGYFYMFDDDTNVLYQRTADSSTSFSYPLDTIINYPVVSAEYDGVNFWTLEQTTVTDLSIKRWYLDNYVCKLQQEVLLETDVNNIYNSNAFTVEHYHTTLSGTVNTGSNRLEVQEYWEKISSGMTVTVGPNVDGISETINVQNWEEGVIILADPVTVDYYQNTKVSFYTNLWLFNNYNGKNSVEGALYKFNAYTGGYITKYPAASYKDVSACTFYGITALTSYGLVNTICYVKATNILFVDIDATGVTLPNYGSMVIDNTHENDIEILEVYDLAIEGDNIYKLQDAANYFGSTEFYGEYFNYHVETQTSMVTSISLLVDPSIIAANGLASTSIKARVKDQFFQPIAGRYVYFGQDDTSGGVIIGGNPVNTDQNGEAGTIYKSGTEAREVKISATVDQV